MLAYATDWTPGRPMNELANACIWALEHPRTLGQAWSVTVHGTTRAAQNRCCALHWAAAVVVVAAADVVVVVVDSVVGTVVVVASVVVVVGCGVLVDNTVDDVARVVALDVLVVGCRVLVDNTVDDVARVVVLEELVVVGGLGQVGSRSTTLIGPPKRSHTGFSNSPRSTAAATCSGVRLKPMTRLLPTRIERMFGSSPRS